MRIDQCALFLLSILTSQIAAAAADWPDIALPARARVIDIGSQLTINGMPMRIRGFTSGDSPAMLQDWFRRQLGEPLVVSQFGGKTILGRAQGEHYLTVQLEASGTGSLGTTSVTQMKLAYDNREQQRDMQERIVARFPAGTRLLSHLSSRDQGKTSTHLTLVNGHALPLNAQRLTTLMRDDGFTLDRVSALSADEPAGPARVADRSGQTLHFTGIGKEATAILFRDEQGGTGMVLNTMLFGLNVK